MKPSIKIFIFLFGLFLFAFTFKIGAVSAVCYNYTDVGYYGSSSACTSYCWGYCNSLGQGYETWSCSGSKCYCVHSWSCSSCAYCAGVAHTCYLYCSGGDTSCGCTSCTNCNSYDGCSGAYYYNYYCSGTSCTYTSTKSCSCVTCGSCQYCSGGNCYNYCSGTDTSCGCTSCTSCNSSDGWYNVGSAYRCCSGSSACSSCQDQQYRNYYCSGTSCTYSVTSTQTVKSGCTACGSCQYCSGGYCYNYCAGTDTSCGCTTCTNCNSSDGCYSGYYRNYYCSGTSCTYSSSCTESCCDAYYGNTNAYCSGGTCYSCKSNSQTCSAGSECCSGYCVDGVCCNSSCIGTCVSCNLAGGVGTCSYVPSGQDPSEECYGTGTCGGTCNSGACQYPGTSVTCSSLLDCDYLNYYYQSGTESPTATEYCYYRDYADTYQYCNGAGSCNALNCSSYSDPLQYSCGICKYISSSSCTGGTLGSCTNYSKGTSCGTNQECNGSGNCVNCAPPSGTISASKTTVQPGETFTISVTGYDDYDVWYLYVKEGTAGTWQSQLCALNQTSCTKTWDFSKTTSGTYQYYGWVIDSDDVNGCASYHESATTPTYVTVTVSKKPNGATCTSGTECTSTYCVDGYCCDTSCTGTCTHCNSTPGTCTYITAGTDPDEECYGTGTCGGTCNLGACQYPGTSVTCSSLLDCDYLNYYYQDPSTDSPTGTDICYYRDYADTYQYCNGAGSCVALNCSSYSPVYQYECGYCKYIPSNYCTGATLGSCSNYALGTSCGANQECNGSGTCVTCYYPTGSISASKTTVNTGETFTISITGNDDHDVYYITYNKGSNTWNDTNKQQCLGAQTACPKAWDLIESTGGTYTYYGWVQDSDNSGGHGCVADHMASIGSVTIIVTQIYPPTARTDPASSITGTSATLNGCVTATGGANYRVRFVWGDTAAYGSASGWTGYYSYTTCFTFNATGLTQGKTYHFRIEAENAAGTGYGSDAVFTTKPDLPSSFTATAVSGSQINLSWSKGSGAYYTMVRRSTTGYPTSPTDGTQVYYDIGTSYSDTGLTAGTKYYYSAWSRAYEETYYQYSDTYVTASETATTPQGDCDIACKNLGYPGGYCAARDWAREQCVLGGYSSEVVDVGFQGKCTIPPILIGSCQCCQSMINTKIDVTAYGTNSIFNKSSVTAGEQVAVGGYLRKTSDSTGISGQYLSLWDCTGACVKVTEGGMDSIGPTDATGYAGKYWAPSNSYQGIKNFILFFAGVSPYNQSQTSAYGLTIFGGPGGFGCTITCTEQYASWWTNPYICVYGGPKLAFTTQKVGTVNAIYALAPVESSTDKTECVHQVSEALGWKAGGQGCANSRMPSVSNADGLGCAIRDSYYSFPLCANCWQYGVYDGSEGKCIVCSGKFENGILGTTLGIYGNPCDTSYVPVTGNGKCESACAVNPNDPNVIACDEKLVDGDCGTGKKCDSACQCISIDNNPPVVTINGIGPAIDANPVDGVSDQWLNSNFEVEMRFTEPNAGDLGLDVCNYNVRNIGVTTRDWTSAVNCNGMFNSTVRIPITVGLTGVCRTEGQACTVCAEAYDKLTPTRNHTGDVCKEFKIDLTPPTTEIK